MILEEWISVDKDSIGRMVDARTIIAVVKVRINAFKMRQRLINYNLSP